MNMIIIFLSKSIHLFKKYSAKRDFEHQSNDDIFYPAAIPKHTFPISTLMQSLKKIGQKMARIESINKFLISTKG